MEVKKPIIIFMLVVSAITIQVFSVLVPSFKSFMFFVFAVAIIYVTYRTFFVLDKRTVIDKLRATKKYVYTFSAFMVVDYFLTWQLYLSGIDFFKAEANPFATWIVGLVGEIGFILCFFLGLYVFCLMMVNIGDKITHTCAKAILCVQLFAITLNASYFII